jgi:uncharacterized protein (TIGR03083 family)
MDRVDWTAEYAATRSRLGDVVLGMPSDDVGRRVPACPDWTVRDLLSHVVGMAAELAGGRFPGGDTQAWIDGIVETRRERTVEEPVDEWHASSDGIDRFIGAMGAGAGQLVYDAVAHEHDIRHALGRPGARDSSGVRASLVAMSGLLERDLDAAGLPAIRLTSDGRTWDVGSGDPALALALEPFEMIRVFGSRRSEAQLRRLPWEGDVQRYLAALSHFPLPVDDLDE